MEYAVTDTDLTSIANAIRNKKNIEGELTYPQAFIDAINLDDPEPEIIESSGQTIINLRFSTVSTYKFPSKTMRSFTYSYSLPSDAYNIQVSPAIYTISTYIKVLPILQRDSTNGNLSFYAINSGTASRSVGSTTYSFYINYTTRTFV